VGENRDELSKKFIKLHEYSGDHKTSDSLDYNFKKA
jgi:hypothetical protein